MHLIVCIDERDGMSFCGRRLSRDSRVSEHILALTAGHTLWVHPYSAKLFPADAVIADAAFAEKAGEGDFCFAELSVTPDTKKKLESVYLYHWNRAYPATVKFPRELLDGMYLDATEEFSGNSHETITLERYVL